MAGLGVAVALERVAAVLPDEAGVLERVLNQQAVALVALRREVADLRFEGRLLAPGEVRVIGEVADAAQDGDV